MLLLPLDDPRWIDLEHRNWRGGRRSHPSVPFIPDELAKLTANPTDIDCFTALWPWMCSEGTTWPAAYATVPYLVSFAESLPSSQRFEYICVIGLIVASSRPQDVPAFLNESFHDALAKALPLTAETLLAPHDPLQTRYLLATVAALKGSPKLAQVLQDLDCIHGTCPKCNEAVYPEELQRCV